MIVSGFIHDVGDFIDQHPGGRSLILTQTGKDVTAAFCGGVYEHSNAAHNVRDPADLILRCSWTDVHLYQLLAMMRVGVLHGGVEHVKTISPGERLRIVERMY